ncbi:uncharacterized protein LOC136088234 [Hydra vulgaris]|uniref:Uncharacterized protein LOC136088234 n=1 Tax=Hydra vulgaris TaxID=6087 RepID=A0ABM4D168_HYDVU
MPLRKINKQKFAEIKIKLPKINLKPFNGQPENWLSFYENFECAIANNNDISGIQKLTHLRSLVEGRASSTIKGLALTNSNFDVAMNLLKEGYNNKQLLISAHMTFLFSLDNINDIRDALMLRKTYGNLEIQIRSLENLGITSSMYGPLLVPIFMQKLPEELNLIISRQFQCCDSWDIKTILEIFKPKFQAYEKSISNASAYDRRPLPIETSLSIETLHSSSSYNNRRNYSTFYNKHLDKNENSCGVFHSHILEIASEFCNDKTVFHNSMSSFWGSETIRTARSDINI